MSTILKGAALISEARRLAIPGRSRMSAEELRTAITAATAPIPSDVGTLLNPPTETYGEQPTPQDATRALSAIFSAPAALPPFRAARGKRKPSVGRRNRRSN